MEEVLDTGEVLDTAEISRHSEVTKVCLWAVTVEDSHLVDMKDCLSEVGNPIMKAT